MSSCRCGMCRMIACRKNANKGLQATLKNHGNIKSADRKASLQPPLVWRPIGFECSCFSLGTERGSKSHLLIVNWVSINICSKLLCDVQLNLATSKNNSRQNSRKEFEIVTENVYPRQSDLSFRQRGVPSSGRYCIYVILSLIGKTVQLTHCLW